MSKRPSKDLMADAEKKLAKAVSTSTSDKKSSKQTQRVSALPLESSSDVPKRRKIVRAPRSEPAAEPSSSSAIQPKQIGGRTRLPVSSIANVDSFIEFFVSPVEEAKVKISQRRREAGATQTRSLERQMAQIARLLKANKDPEFISLRKEFFTLKNQIHQISNEFQKKATDAREEFDQGMKKLEASRLEALSRLQYGIESDEIVPESTDTREKLAATAVIEKDFKHEKAALAQKLSAALEDSYITEPQRIAEIEAQIRELRMGKAARMFSAVLSADKSLADAVSLLQQSVAIYPDSSESARLAPKTLEFITKESQRLKKSQEEVRKEMLDTFIKTVQRVRQPSSVKEVLTLLPPRYDEFAEDYMERGRAIVDISKADQRTGREIADFRASIEREEAVQPRRSRISRRMDSDEEVSEAEEELASDEEAEADEEPFGIGRGSYAAEPSEEEVQAQEEKASRLTALMKKKKKAVIEEEALAGAEEDENGYMDDEDAESEEEEDSEDEEVPEPTSKRRKVIIEKKGKKKAAKAPVEESESEPEESEEEQEELPETKAASKRVTKIRRTRLALTKGEALLEDLPILQIPSNRYREIYDEIQTLKREVNYVNSLYHYIETNVAEPFMERLGLSRANLISMFQYAFNGKPLENPIFLLQSFDLNDEQKMIAKLALESDKNLRADVIATVFGSSSQPAEPPITLAAFPNYTTITHKLDGMTEKEWVERYYEMYKPYVQRVQAKIEAETKIRAVEMSLLQRFATKEQNLLIKTYIQSVMQNGLQDHNAAVAAERVRLESLTIEEKLIAGIPVMPTVAPILFERFNEAKVKLDSMIHSKVELKTDYPFTASFEQISQYVPELLLRTLARHRSEIKSTRESFMRKLLLSKLTVDQYVYVKVFMGHYETSDFFKRLIVNIRSAHLYAVDAEKNGLLVVSSIGNDDLKSMAIQLVDYYTSDKLSSIFEKKMSIAEYESEFRKLVPLGSLPPGSLQKTEYTFLTDCRYAMRSNYDLKFPIIGSVEDMKVLESVIPRVLENPTIDIKTLLKEENKGLSDVNPIYQTDTINAFVENHFINLIDKEEASLMETLHTQYDKLARDPATKRRDIKPLVAPVIARLKALQNDISKRLEKVDESLFVSVEETLGKAVDRIFLYLNSKGAQVDKPAELEIEYKKTVIPKKKSPLQLMMKKLVNTRVRKDGPSLALPRVDVMNVEVEQKEALTVPKSEQFLNAISVISKIKTSAALTKTQIGFLQSAPILHMIELMKEDDAKGKFKGEVAHPMNYYKGKFEEVFVMCQGILKKHKIEMDLSKAQEHGFQRIETLYMKLSNRVALDYTRNKYINMQRSKESYKWEDRGVLSIHPELLRFMPIIAIEKASAPIEFTGLPLSVPVEGWTRPSVLFFHTLANTDAIILKDGAGIRVNDLVIKLARVIPSGVIDLSSDEYITLVRAAGMKSVMEAFHKSEMVVIPTQIDSKMVYLIQSNSLFYPGWETVAIQSTKADEIQDRIDALQNLSTKMPSKEKIQLRIQELESKLEEATLEQPSGDLSGLEKAFRISIMVPEKQLKEILDAEERLREQELFGDDIVETEKVELLDIVSRKQSVMDKLKLKREEYIQQLRKFLPFDEQAQARIQELTNELSTLPVKKTYVDKDVLKVRAGLEQQLKVILKAEGRLDEMKEENLSGYYIELEKEKLLTVVAKKQAILDQLSALPVEKPVVDFVRKGELDILDGKLAELQKLKSIQRERFVRDYEIRRLQLNRQLISDGWMRPTINLIREMNRKGKISSPSQIRVDKIDYTCAIIKYGRITPLRAEQVMSEITGFYQKKQSSDYSQLVLQSFLPPAEDEYDYSYAVEDEQQYDWEDEDMYGGTRSKSEMVCANCHKKILTPWRNTVQLIDGQHRVVPLCSEKCSEEYHPSK